MESKIVSTNDFWEAMCDPRFIRTRLHQGRIGGVSWYTVEVGEAPEEVEGFIAGKICQVVRLLEPGPTLWERITGIFK